MIDSIAGRSYAQVYRVARRDDIHQFLADAVARSGGQLLYISQPDRAPIYLGVQSPQGERLGILCYPFRCNPPLIKGRPADEHRFQIRYGGEALWIGQEHPVGLDIAGVDTTIMLGAHLHADLFIGVDPRSYDPLPMGISIEFRQNDVDEAAKLGWHVWERETRFGTRRTVRTGEHLLETLVAFRPERLLSYVAFERRASDLRLDPPLRFKAAQAATRTHGSSVGAGIHTLEREFELTSKEILQLIAQRSRLSVAVRGGVAEHHLGRRLEANRHVVSATLIERDGEPDFNVLLKDGRRILVECKNVSPNTYSDGTPKVEVQKTRSQRDDPAGRFYRPEQFDVVAACLYPVTGKWEFRFKRSSVMDRHPQHPGRLAVLHRVDGSWQDSLVATLDP